MQTKHYIGIAAVVGLAIGIGGWLLFAPKNAQAPSSSTASTTVTDLGNGVVVQTTGSTTIKEIDGQPAVSAPTVKPIAFSANTSADLKTALTAQYDILAPQLRAAPNRIDLWLQLGVLYKIANDYPDAVVAWGYVAKNGTPPNNTTAYGDLGDLYLNFTHEYAKAEASYKAALALDPKNTDFAAGLKAAQQAQGK